jgi:dTDP-glucose 4,6-dehydratase/UDP-glucose 4-epimerase
MKILIVGSKGFIGSHCISHFSELGYKTIGCDVHQVEEENYINIKSIDLNQLFADHQFDFCINAAGSAHVNYSFEFPEKDFELNVSLVIKLLGAIKNNSPKCKFVNFSSAAVYGNPSFLPVIENSQTNPLSPYGYHKLLSENLLLEYCRFFKLQTASLRVFSAYGEGLKKQLFWDLYNKSLGSEELRLFGTGFESRDFIYVHDLIMAVHAIIKKGEFRGEVYNIGNGEEILIKDAVSIFLNEMGWNKKVIFSGEEKVGDPVNWKADIQKIKTLGYRRNYNFVDGLKKQCEWLKSLK